jgi:hypothetical protein
VPTGLDEINIEDKARGKIVFVTFKEEVNKQDYQKIIPQLEWLISNHQKIRILIELRDIKGWSASALWEETKFGAKHFNDVDRLAIVGEKQWKKNIAKFVKPFTSAEIRYFQTKELEQAKHWISA